MQSSTRNLQKPKTKLWNNIQGLSTMEYAVLFVVIVVGALTVWGALGKNLSKQIDQGRIKYRDTLTIDDKE